MLEMEQLARVAVADLAPVRLADRSAFEPVGRDRPSFVRRADDTPLVEDAAFPWLARDTPFGRNCYIFAEGEFLQQRAQ